MSKKDVLKNRHAQIYTEYMERSLYHNFKLLSNQRVMDPAHRKDLRVNEGIHFYSYKAFMSHRVFFFGAFNSTMVGIYKKLNNSLPDIALASQLSSNMPLGIGSNGGGVVFSIGLPNSLWDIVKFNEIIDKTKNSQIGIGLRADGNKVTYIDLDEDFSNALISGQTRSGKTIVHLSILLSFILKTKVVFVNIDVSPKKGRSGKSDSAIPSWTTFDNMTGNLSDITVTDLETAQKYLAVAVNEISLRADDPGRFDRLGRLLINIDEADDLFSDPICEMLLNTIITKGAASGVNVIVATQHPKVDVLGSKHGSTIKRNLGNVICGRVADSEASRVILGDNDGTCSGHQLNGYGDMLVKSPIDGITRVTTPKLTTVDVTTLGTYGEKSLSANEIYNDDMEVNEVLDRLINGEVEDKQPKNVKKEIQPRYVGALIQRYMEKGSVGSDQTVRKLWTKLFPDDENPGGKFNQRIIDFTKKVIETSKLKPC